MAKLIIELLTLRMWGFLVTAQTLYDMSKGVQTRWASPGNMKGEKGAGGIESGGRKGSGIFPIKAGELKTLTEVSQTSGVIRRIWITINDCSLEMIEGLKIKMCWEGNTTPAVFCSLSEFLIKV